MSASRGFEPPFPPYPGIERRIEVPFRPSERWSSILGSLLTPDAWEWALVAATLPSHSADSFFADGNGRGPCEKVYIRFAEGNFGARVDLLRYLADCHAWFDYFAGLGPEPLLTGRPVRSLDGNSCNLLPSNRKTRAPDERAPPDGAAPRRAARSSPLIAKVRVGALFLGLNPDEEARRHARWRNLEDAAWRTWLEKGRA